MWGDDCATTYYCPWHPVSCVCQWKSMGFSKTVRFVTVFDSRIVPTNATSAALERIPPLNHSTLFYRTIESSWYQSLWWSIIIASFGLDTSSVLLPLSIFLARCGSSRSCAQSSIALPWHPLPPHKRGMIPTFRKNYSMVYMRKEETVYVYICLACILSANSLKWKLWPFW